MCLVDKFFNNFLVLFHRLHLIIRRRHQMFGRGGIHVYCIFHSFGSMVDIPNATSRHQHITMIGFMGILVYCIISAFAGVYTEYILKKDQDTSLHMQNMMLYCFSISINFLVFISTNTGNDGNYIALY